MSIEHKINEQIKQQVNYKIIGSGQNLVLIHGWGVNSAVWLPIAQQLSQHYCVHLVDLPGFGEQPELTDYSLASIAETLLDKLPKNAVWCGWSLGGLIATYVAYHFPDRVEKLIQVCASLKFVEQGQWSGVKKEVFEAFKVGVTNQPQKTLNRFLSLQSMGSDSVKTDIATIKNLLVDQPEPKQSALIAGLDLLNEVDLRTEFSELTMPCLSIFGEKDNLVPMNNAATLLELNPSNQQVIFERSSHMPFISESNLFKATLISFIE
ncbi:pimeloyl-ACP methyl ester esterase BioH [uncultured Psychromonas sp.]|uniref:pimeloyl-ACP methyl ester esterase BioH n=1 Tax=uncultured Psychromonas sp. TaxID=173974 RepID=UPI00260E28DE|nr:pimeloyl-ACP methyl ester esterase BioH [uncultured Psychromonas sp.]